MNLLEPLYGAMDGYAAAKRQKAEDAMRLQEFNQRTRSNDLAYNTQNLAYQKQLRGEQYAQKVQSDYQDYLKNTGTTDVANPAYVSPDQYSQAVTAGPPTPYAGDAMPADNFNLQAAYSNATPQTDVMVGYQAQPETVQKQNAPMDFLKFAIKHAQTNGAPPEYAQGLQDHAFKQISNRLAASGTEEGVKLYNEMFPDNPLTYNPKLDLLTNPKTGAQSYVDKVGLERYLQTNPGDIQGALSKFLIPVAAGQHGKIIDKTVDLGDRQLIQYADGTQEERAKAARPDTVVKIENGNRVRSEKQAIQKPLPPSMQKEVLAKQDALAISSNIQADTQSYIDMIKSGDLKLGPVQNKMSAGKNFLGMSDATSQNYTAFNTFVNKLRNDILMLAKGVQTEGDALRAYQVLMENLNDPNVVSNQLGIIQKQNARNADLQQNQIDNIYSMNGQDSPDSSQFRTQPSVVAPVGAKPSAGSVKSGDYIVKVKGRK